MKRRSLELDREQILTYRRRTQSLDERLSPGPDSLRRAASPGLQDSVPRSALHSLYARVEQVPAEALDDPALAQVWGPRYTAFVVPAGEHVPFTLGRLPPKGRTRRRAEELADRLDAHLAGRRGAVRGSGSGAGRAPEQPSVRLPDWNGPDSLGWCPAARHLDHPPARHRR